MTHGRFVLVILVFTTAASMLAATALAGDRVPLRGSDRGSFTLTPNGCAAGVFRVVIDDSGVASQLGNYDYHSNECFDGGAGTFAGEFTMTAADGSTVSGTYAGEIVGVDGDLGYYEQVNVITGGTGRFAGASGEFDLSGIANLATLDSSQRIDGTISSPGAAKS